MNAYSATSDFSTTSNTGSNTWSYRYKENRVRDGDYRLIETFEPGLQLRSQGTPLHADPGPDPVAWQVDADTPWVAKNASGVDLTLEEFGRTITWPRGALVVHPGDEGLVVVRWCSPAGGAASIELSVADAYPSGGGDGIAWYVEHSGQALGRGDIPNGGEDSHLSLTDVAVNEGDFIDFVVDSKGDHTCDWTRLEISISL